MTTYPPASLPLFPAGYGPLAADFTTWVTDNFGFLSTGAVLRVQQTTSGGQVLSSGFNALAFNQVLEDPWSGWSAAGSGSQPADSWLCPVTGLYEITVCGCISGASVFEGGGVQVSGGPTIQGSNYLSAASTVGGADMSVITTLVAGIDYVQGGFVVSTAATTDTTVPGRYPAMEIALVSQ